MLGDSLLIVKELNPAVTEKMDDKFTPISNNSPADRVEYEYLHETKSLERDYGCRRRSTSRLGDLYTC